VHDDTWADYYHAELVRFGYDERSCITVPVEVIDGILDPDECQRFIELYAQLPTDPDKSSGRGSPKQFWLAGQHRGIEKWNLASQAGLIGGFEKQAKRIFSWAFALNLELWKYAIHPVLVRWIIDHRPISDAGFPWHWDFKGHDESLPDPPLVQKLTILVQLSRDDEYDGGDLEIFDGSRVLRAPRQQGDMIVMPTFLPHRVLPVRRGARMVLGNHLMGPPFR
jgi:hypothetical protein